MQTEQIGACTAFLGAQKVASGDLRTVAIVAKRSEVQGKAERLLVFDDRTGRVVDLDLSGTIDEMKARYPLSPAPPTPGHADRGGDAASPSTSKRGRGRPKLGVVSREVTLLPRHWAWLSRQRGGASAALRRLVEQARQASASDDRVRDAQDAAYRFLTAMVGNEPGFEEAMRALFARDEYRFTAESERWPPDLRDYGRGLAAAAFTSSSK